MARMDMRLTEGDMVGIEDDVLLRGRYIEARKGGSGVAAGR